MCQHRTICVMAKNTKLAGPVISFNGGLFPSTIAALIWASLIAVKYQSETQSRDEIHYSEHNHNTNDNHSHLWQWWYISCCKHTTSTQLLKQIQWLPNKWRIRFKLTSLTFKALYTLVTRPPYLADLLQYYKPASPHAHLPVTYFQFYSTTFHLVLGLFISLHQKYGIPYVLTFCRL